MNTDKLSSDTLKRVRVELDPALAAIAARLGLASLKLGSGRYDPAAGSFSFKLEGMVNGGISADAQRYEMEVECYKCGKWPKRGETIRWANSNLIVAGMGKGGAIYMTGAEDGKAYTIKRAQWERKYGSIIDDVEIKVSDRLFGGTEQA